MIYLNGNFYVEVKGKGYSVHPPYDTILREQNERRSSRRHYQVKNKTQIRKNQKVIENGN